MAISRRKAMRDITNQLIDLLSSDARTDLAKEDVLAALSVHFPDVGLRALPSGAIGDGDCSVDGYYDPYTDPRQPWIFYEDEVVPERLRFTLTHELGHHLLATTGAELLDTIDTAAGALRKPADVEEDICHLLAGSLLIPDELLHDIVPTTAQLRPSHIRDLAEQTTASWEAACVRAVDAVPHDAVACLVRERGRVAFVASNSFTGWRRGSIVKPGGPLDRALTLRATAIPETYRFDLGYAEKLFCDVEPIHNRLSIAVLARTPSDRHVEVLEDEEPIWKREQFCAFCGNERTVGWCDDCKGRHCMECSRCGCSRPVEAPICPECSLANPLGAGSRVCVDCEADGLG